MIQLCVCLNSDGVTLIIKMCQLSFMNKTRHSYVFELSFYFHIMILIFSFTGRRPASNCHGVVSVVRPFVRAFVRACARKLFLQKTSPQKLLTGFLRNFTRLFLRWSSFKFQQIILFYEEFWLPW